MPPLRYLALVAVAVAAAGLAFLAGGNLALAVPFALVATGAAAFAAALPLQARLKRPAPRPPPPAPDPTVALRDGLAGGAFGRQTVLAHLRALEHRMRPGAASPDPTEEARLLALPRGDFLRWVDERVRALEEES